MKTWKKILLCVLLLILVALVALCVWQRDNLAALKTSVSYSREDIAVMMEENDRKIAQSAQSVEGVTVRDLTEEEKQDLRTGELNQEELLELLTTQLPEQCVTPEAQPSPESPQPPVQEESAEKALSKCLAEIYLMKAEYTAWLEDKNQEAIDEYVALEESQRTTAAKYSIGMRCMREALEKEKECDARMEEMKEKIRVLLDKLGRDDSLIDEIQAAYEEEKELKKAYFLGLHD